MIPISYVIGGWRNDDDDDDVFFFFQNTVFMTQDNVQMYNTFAVHLASSFRHVYLISRIAYISLPHDDRKGAMLSAVRVLSCMRDSTL